MSTTLAKVNKATLDFAAKVQEAITFDDDGDSTLPETLAADNLELVTGDAEMTMDHIVKAQNATAAISGGLLLGLGNASVDVMKKNTNVNRTTAHVEFGNDIIRAAVDREIEVRIPQTGETKKKLGNGSIRLESGAVAKRGDIKKVLTHINENFTANLGK